MSKEQMISKVSDIVTDTFEKLAFLFLVPLDQICVEEEESISVRVLFEGPHKGSMTLKVPILKAQEIAQNMLGIDDATEESVVEDALKECINILCGNVLPELFGKREIFKIGRPFRIDLEEGVDNSERGFKVSFESEDGYCLTVSLLLGSSLEEASKEGEAGSND